MCESCSFSEKLARQIKVIVAGFDSKEMAAAFASYGTWLGLEIGYPKAYRALSRHLPFFTEIENKWQHIPSYVELLQHFGTGRLRRAELAVRWILQSTGEVPDRTLQAEVAEYERIDKLLTRLRSESLHWQVIHSYWAYLLDRVNQQKLKIRSARLALTPAVKLLQHSTVEVNDLPTQANVDAYLLETPGQKMALNGFLAFLNRNHGTSLAALTSSRLYSHQERKQFEKQLLQVMRNVTSETQLSTWLPLSLAYYHGVPLPVGVTLTKREAISVGHDGITVQWREHTYWVPKLLYEEEALLTDSATR